ncbi:MAG: TlyA family RNA methyltransferase [Kiritimatiellae bacterium]|nr:TlyA family RNA methyltransferase [Kiritimatiellia bacterium]
MKQRLDEILVARGYCDSRSQAQRIIMEGKVRVKGVVSPKAGNKYDSEIELELAEENRFVSRGGLKLEGAFNEWHFNVEGFSCLDVGASTGGFTDCLLQHGAARVVAVDVGHSQIHPRLLQDPRVISIEKFNARNMTSADLPFVPDFAVCDVSFISLRLILPPMMDVLKPGGEMVTLIKPQFEAGREQVGKGGVVRDEAVRLQVVESIKEFGESIGLEWLGYCVSPITGPAGNVEYTARWRKKLT